jgi:hypothetical protein
MTKDTYAEAMGSQLVWRCFAAECGTPLARDAGWVDAPHRTKVALRVEMVRIPSQDAIPTYGRTRKRAKDHRNDWSGQAIEYRDHVVLPVRVHCPRCKRSQTLKERAKVIATDT